MASRPAAQAPSGSSATAAATPIPHSPGGSQDAKVSSSSLSSSSGTSAASPGPWRPSFARQQSNSTLSSPSASTPTTSRSNSLLRHHSTRNSSSSSSSTSSTSGGGSGVATGSGSSSHHHPMESPSLSAALSKDTGYFSHPGSSSPRLSSPSIYNKPSSPGPGSGSGGASGGNFSSSMPTSQTMNLESLAAKFADSKEIKEKFAKLQLSPALSPGGFLDKDRRGANPSSSSSAGSSVLPANKSHHHHPRSTPSGHSSPSIPSSSSFGQSSPMHSPLLRQQSLGHVGSSALSSSSSSTSPQKPTAPSPSLLSTTAATTVGTATGATSANLATPSSPATLNGSNGLKSPLSQSTDMRRTASHNSAFATGLGAPISIHQSNGSSPSLAPFSLGSIAPTPRRSSLHPDDPAAPTALAAKYKDQHPLQHSWTLYFDVSMGFGRQGSSLHHFESGLKELGIFQSVESFARYFNWIPKPHKMDNSTNYHLFKDGIKPMWEDPANAKGGRWIVTLLSKNPELLDKYWLELAYALVGEQLDEDDDICGAVLSRRTKADRLAVWVRDRDNITAINGIGKRLIKLLDFGKERMSLEFQITGDVATTPIATPKRYITLDTIRRDLEAEQQENVTKARRESLDASAANTEDSQVAAEGSAVGAASGEESSNSKARKNSYDETVAGVAGSSGGGGLLISMESAPTKNTPIVSVTRTEIEA